MHRSPQKPDHVKNLLADILEDTQDQAQREQRALQRARDQRLDALRQQEIQQEEERRQRAQAMLEAEQRRRQEAARRRTDLLRALDGPSDAEQEALRRAEEEARRRAQMEEQLRLAQRARLEAERKAAEVARQSAQRLAMAPVVAPVAPRQSRAPLWIAAGAMACALGLALAGGVVLWWGQAQAPAPATWSKVTYQPTELRSQAVEGGFVALPSAPPQEAQDPQARRPRRPGQARPTPDKPQPRKFNFGDAQEDVFNPKRQ